MKTDFFSACKTQADAKALYQRLCSKYHPDKQDAKDQAETTAIMQEINRQYQQFKPSPNPANASETREEITISQLRDVVGNWYIIENFISEQIIACQTHLVEELFSQCVFEWDEIEQPEATTEIIDVNGRCIVLTESEAEDYQEAIEEALDELQEIEDDLSLSEYESDIESPLSPVINHPLFNAEIPLSMAINALERCYANLINADFEHHDILEWWLIEESFARNLTIHNQSILNNEFGCWWGRTVSGQDLSGDSLFWEIAYNADLFKEERAA